MTHLLSGYLEYFSHKADKNPYLSTTEDLAGSTWSWVADPAEATIFTDGKEARDWLEHASANGLGLPMRQECRFVPAAQHAIVGKRGDAVVWLAANEKGPGGYSFAEVVQCRFRNLSYAQEAFRVALDKFPDVLHKEIVPAERPPVKESESIECKLEKNTIVQATRDFALATIIRLGPKVDLETLLGILGARFGSITAMLILTYMAYIRDVTIYAEGKTWTVGKM